MTINRAIEIIFIGRAKDRYLQFTGMFNSGTLIGSSGSFYRALINSVNSKIDCLKMKYDCGIKILKKLFPLVYSREYGISNLWKLNLAGYWRMLYAIRMERIYGSEHEIVVIVDILDIISHEEYDKLFGYRKK